ncbi:hypothetical protein SELMODRAFT_49683, partial [Selaginella moellendorffii]
ASLAARRDAQRRRVCRLYRKALHHTLDWVIFREPFYKEASKLRARFDVNKDVVDVDAIERLIVKGEAEFKKFQHPEPYAVPWSPEGVTYARNPPLPAEVCIFY